MNLFRGVDDLKVGRECTHEIAGFRWREGLHERIERSAGLGVAFRAKPLVKQSAEQSISTLGLDAILYLLGFSDRYQNHSVESQVPQVP